MRKLVAVNDQGRRIGESHHRAELTDHEADLVRELHDEGYSYGWLAQKFDIGKSTARDICTYRCRGQACADVRMIAIKPGKVLA